MLANARIRKFVHFSVPGVYFGKDAKLQLLVTWRNLGVAHQNAGVCKLNSIADGQDQWVLGGHFREGSDFRSSRNTFSRKWPPSVRLTMSSRNLLQITHVVICSPSIAPMCKPKVTAILRFGQNALMDVLRGPRLHALRVTWWMASKLTCSHVYKKRNI